MKFHFLIITFISFISVQGQNSGIFTRWTDGSDFYWARPYNQSIIQFSGGNLHEGGAMFSVKIINDSTFNIVGRHPEEDFPPSYGEIGYKIEYKELGVTKILILTNEKDEVIDALTELKSGVSFENYILNNKVNFELAGIYIDEEGKEYRFSTNRKSATGFGESQIYKFETEYDYPIEVITFTDKESYYYDLSGEDLIIYLAMKDEYGDFEKGERIMYLKKIKWLNHTKDINIAGIYPFASTDVLLRHFLWYFDKKELRIMRNEIFSRHGYRFKTSEMKSYFESQDWYSPRYDNVDNKLSELEKLNIKLIQHAEKK